MNKFIRLVRNNTGNEKTSYLIPELMVARSALSWIPACAGMTVFSRGSLTKAALAEEKKRSEADCVTAGYGSDPAIPAQAGIQSGRECSRAFAGLTVFFRGRLTKAALAEEEKRSDADFVTVGYGTDPVIPAQAGIQSGRECSRASTGLTVFFRSRLTKAALVEEKKRSDADFVTAGYGTDPVIPAQAGIQSGRKGNPVLIKMMGNSANKKVLPDSTKRPEACQ